MELCNTCGIPEKEWKDTRICTACGKNRQCHIEDDMIIPKRVFEYANKNGLLDMGTFFAESVRRTLSHKKTIEKLPSMSGMLVLVMECSLSLCVSFRKEKY